MKVRIAIITLIIVIVALPLFVVQIIPTDSPEPYVFKSRIIEKLDETLGGTLQYLLVEYFEGNAPASEFVVAISSSYGRGFSNADLEENEELWMQGSLMTPDVYFGEHYLFFDRPQIYVRQIKGEVFWPDQITELRILWASPTTSLSAAIFVWVFPFSEEFQREAFLILITKTILICATIYFLISYKKKPWHIALTILAYAFLTMILTVLVLTDLY